MNKLKLLKGSANFRESLPESISKEYYLPMYECLVYLIKSVNEDGKPDYFTEEELIYFNKMSKAVRDIDSLKL